MLDLTTFDAALKEYYTPEAVEDMVYENNPLLALMPKDEKMIGEYKVIPVIVGNPQGRSASFARAQARGTLSSSVIKKFNVTRIHDYHIATIDNETILASEGDTGAFMEAATLEIDGAIQSLTNTIACDLYRAGWGDRGVVGSVSSATLTLATITDIVNFEVGMELVISTAQSTAALRALGSSGNGLIITGINRSTGVLTFAYNVTDATNGIPSTGAGDYIFVRGDREDSATPTRLKISGLEAWIPNAGVTSTSFFGLDRTIDATRLGGLAYDGSAYPIEEALIEGASLVSREGGAIDHYFISHAKYASLEKALGSKVQYVDLAANARISFKGIRINGPDGEIKVVADRNCPTNRCFGLKLSTWKLGSIGKAVRVIDTDGNKMLRMASADGVEVRYGTYSNAMCKAPGRNINIKL